MKSVHIPPSSLIILGYKRPLEKSDLWSLNLEDTAKYVTPRFEKYWKQEVEKMKRYAAK